MRKNIRLANAFIASVSTLAFANLASAQSAPRSAAAGSEQLQEVIITGSRVLTNGNQSPTPVTVVPVEDIMALQPTTISEALNTLPQFGGSQTSTSGPGSGIRNGSAAYITLRNAGDNHTLILYDGHRMLPAAPQESHSSDVDINLIPQILLQRVDIVTGGTSAVYGSDAISGVVNFITDTKFTGIKANASYGVSNYKDDRTTDAAVAYGQNLIGGRGHAEFSYEYRNDPGILDPANKYQRPFFAATFGGGGLGTAASPYTLTPNTRIGTTSFGGKIVSATGAIAAWNNLNFTQNGTLVPFVNGTTVVGSTSLQGGGDGAYYYNSTIKSSLRYHKLFGRFDYDVNDSTHGYLQYGWTTERSENYFQSITTNINIGLNNPYLDTVTVQSPTLTTAQFQSLLAAQRVANPNGNFRLSKFLLNAENQPIRNKMDFGMLLGGLDGTIGKYNWDFHFGHSWANADIRNLANLDQGRLFAATNTVRDASGNIVCRAASLNPAYSGCVPLNLLGPTSESAAAIAYITRQTRASTNVKLDELQTSLTGAPFSSWAGPVNTAISAEWHRTTYKLDSDATPGELADCNGIQFATLTGAAVTGNCNGPNTNNPTLRWASNTLTPLNPGVSVSTTEVAAEANIPFLKDARFAKALDLDTAVRYTNYSTSGTAWTWKLGLNWQVNDQWRFRATRSRDIRAANLNELFSPPAVNLVQNFQDFVVNGVGTTQVANVPRVQYADPNLKPETADTMTAGFVYESSRLPGFSISLDAFRIKMKNTIFQLRGIDQPIIDACKNSGGTAIYCSWYIRPTPTSFPTQIVGYLLNIAGQDTYGADLEVGYAARVRSRALNLRGLVSYQPHNIFDTGPGGVIDTGGAYYGGPSGVAASPHLRATITGKFNFTEAFSVSVMERWRSAMVANATTSPSPTPIYAVNQVPAVAYTNLTLSYTIKRQVAQVEVYANVQNLFNKFPTVEVGGPPAPVLPATRGIQPMPLGDDPIGRYYVMGLRLRM
jgi:outer membrane receptor protein involved in Fe transport